MTSANFPNARRGDTSRPYGVRLGLWLTCVAALVLACFAAVSPASARPLRLLAFGDSLTAGYGLPHADGFVAKLQAALRAQGFDVEVVDGGVSGDTTSGGLARLDWTLGAGADAAIVELGANDMLRGVDPKVTEANLGQIVARLQAKHVRVLLAGMRAMPNLGKDYDQAFDVIYQRLAARYHVLLYPFFLDGILGDESQHLPDGMHPNARGVDTIVAHILPSAAALLRSVGAKG